MIAPAHAQSTLRLTATTMTADACASHLALRLVLVNDCVDCLQLLAEVVNDVLGLVTLTTQDVDLAVNLQGA
jgi:hypothetical protein